MQNAPLYGLAAVAQIGDGTIDDDVAGVLEEIAPHQRLKVGHDPSEGGAAWTRP